MTAPSPLPLAAREAAWRQLWATLLAPADRSVSPAPPPSAPAAGREPTPKNAEAA